MTRKTPVWVITYLALLFLAVVTGWYLAASDVVSIQVINSSLTDHAGKEQPFYRAGDELVIHREFCLSGYVQFTATPHLTDASGTVFPLASGVYAAGRGCKKASYGFIIPDLPAGVYQLHSTFTYQNGPLNEEAHLVLPALTFEVRP